MALENKTNPEIEELKKQINTIQGKLTTLESKKNAIEKEAKELVAKTVYERRRDMERGLTEIVSEAEHRLKGVESEKADERKKNIKNLVNENTKELRDSNVYLNNEIKKVLNENKLPGFVNSDFYMSLWHPTNIKQYLIAIATAAGLLLIPTLICFVTHKEELEKVFGDDIFKTIIVILIYCGFVFIFGIIWLLIEKITKKSPETLNKVVEIRKNIDDNKKEINSIAIKIEKETTDDQFDYTKLDREIESVKLEVEKYKNKKEAELKKFEEVTALEIEKQIMNEANTSIKKINKEMENVKKELTAMQTKMDELKISVITA